MAGRHSSLWDHVAWVYFSKDQQRAANTASVGLSWSSGFVYLARAFISGKVFRLPARRQARAIFGLLLYVVPTIIWGACMAVFMTGWLQEHPHWLPWVMRLCFFFPAVWFIAMWSTSNYRSKELRAIYLRVRRTSILRPGKPAIEPVVSLRSEWWTTALSTSPTHTQQTNYTLVDPRALLWSTIPMVLYFAFFASPIAMPSTTGAPFSVGAPLFAPFVLVAMLPFVLWIQRRMFRRTRERLLAAMSAHHCPDCEYDIRSTVRDASTIPAGWPGPPRCPECSAPWPLLPPPIPASADDRMRSKPMLFRDVGGLFRAAGRHIGDLWRSITKPKQ